MCRACDADAARAAEVQRQADLLIRFLSEAPVPVAASASSPRVDDRREAEAARCQRRLPMPPGPRRQLVVRGVVFDVMWDGTGEEGTC
jgi:hypothetical protein